VQGKSGIESQIKNNVYILVPGRPQLRIQEVFDRLGVLDFALIGIQKLYRNHPDLTLHIGLASW
jgi:hypothetical protein